MKRKKRRRDWRTPAVMLALLLSGIAAIWLIQPADSRAVMVANPTLNPSVTPRVELVDLTAAAPTYLPVVRRGERPTRR